MLLLGALLALWAATSFADAADGTRHWRTVVDDYVREALDSNLALRGQAQDVERQLALLAEARSRFLPQLDLAARYTWADGGRQIELAGDASVFNFLRDQEQDTRLSLRQALYAPAIPAAWRAQKAELDSATYAREALSRRLERDVTVGYLDWLQATASVEIVESSLALLRENLRVNESLYANGRITQDQVLRAEAELLAVQQQSREAANLASRAAQLLNFLRNEPLDAPLERPSAVAPDPATTAGAGPNGDQELRAAALDRRPELQELAAVERAAGFRIDQQQAARKPLLSLGVDGGIQGEDYEFGTGYNFGTASLQVTMPLFSAGGIQARVDAARASARQTALRRAETARQIELEVQQALDRLRTASDSLRTAEARAAAARAGFRIAEAKRDLGVINQVAFLDARTALTSAELNLNLTRFAFLSRQADLAYATAVNPLPLDDGAS
jgi:outer membrane protein TolC